MRSEQASAVVAEIDEWEIPLLDVGFRFFPKLLGFGKRSWEPAETVEFLRLLASIVT